MFVPRDAAKKGHLHVLQWALAQTPPASYSEDTCGLAANNDRLDIVFWLIDNDYPHRPSVYDYAIQYGYSAPRA